jgi:hypothetical protein
VIPTHYKAKLPKTLSWPLGAEAITAGLGDAPHAAECVLRFHDTPVWPASDFRRTLRESEPYTVLVVEYRPAIRLGNGASRAMEADGMYDAQWRVYVYPVERTRRATVGRLLREQGLPAAAGWLRSVVGDRWQDAHHRIELIYAPADGTLSKRCVAGR